MHSARIACFLCRAPMFIAENVFFIPLFAVKIVPQLQKFVVIFVIRSKLKNNGIKSDPRV